MCRRLAATHIACAETEARHPTWLTLCPAGTASAAVERRAARAAGFAVGVAEGALQLSQQALVGARRATGEVGRAPLLPAEICWWAWACRLSVEPDAALGLASLTRMLASC